MLEGLLRNYSIEVGKGTASKSAASGVVLKQQQSKLRTTRDNRGSVADGTFGSNSSRNGEQGHGAHNTADIKGNGHVAQNRSKFWGRTITAAGAESIPVSLLSNATQVPGGTKRCDRTQVSQPKSRSLADTTLNEKDMGTTVEDPVAPETKVARQPTDDSSSDLIGSVLQMILSAKAAGVRKVVLEASMKVSTMSLGTVQLHDTYEQNVESSKCSTFAGCH